MYRNVLLFLNFVLVHYLDDTVCKLLFRVFKKPCYVQLDEPCRHQSFSAIYLMRFVGIWM